MAFEIEIGVPLPTPNTRSSRTGMADAVRALAAAPVGASVFIPLIADISARDHSVRTASRFHTLGGPGWYTSRSDADGVRVWKTGESPKLAADQKRAA